MLRRPLSGGALYLSVFISLILSILLSMLVLRAYYETIGFERFAIAERVHNNVQSGFNYVISDACDMTEEPKKIDLFENGTDSVDIVKKSWGCYTVVGVRSHWKGVEEALLCLAGTDFLRDTALILTENNKSISVAGKTLLKGICLIPKAGIKPAHIEGESFWGASPIDGSQLQAPQTVPELNKNILEIVEKTAAGEADSLVSLSDLPKADTVRNSFMAKTLRVSGGGTIVLEETRLKGNIIVQSSNRIVVRKHAVLENVLLLAPTIEIEEGFSGAVQAMATDSIIVGNEVGLTYPSSLIVVHQPMLDTSRKTMSIPAILVGEKCSIKGTIAVCLNKATLASNAFLKLKKESQVQGLVYSSGYLDAQGTIFGTAMARTLILQTASGVYEQHLLNAVIDRNALSDFFVAGNLFSGRAAKRIVKWLN